MSDTHISQAADARLGWDIKVTKGMVLGQNEGSSGVGSHPIPMERSNLVTRLEECSVILSKSYPTSIKECYTKVSNPFKPNSWVSNNPSSC